uniref:Uncharacterized protein n=1 Tax=Quercus lobata TaxID=97700 RepID=A0A7N2MUB1_QUELO
MAWSATMIGALLGLGTQMYSNALRKLPYMRHPWEHVVGMGLGVVFVNQLVKWDAQLAEDLDKMLEKAKAANERRYFAIFKWVFSYISQFNSLFVKQHQLEGSSVGTWLASWVEDSSTGITQYTVVWDGFVYPGFT